MAIQWQGKIKATIKDLEHCSRVVRSLQSFNSQQSYTDLCFVCAHGVKVYAHKLLVCSVSTLLKELLLQVPDNLSKITIHVPDIDSRILQLIINLLYEGNVRIARNDYDKFKEIMSLLGIVLEPPGKSDNSGSNEDPPPPPPAPSAPHIPQMMYVPNSPASQGGVQYMLAPSSMVQGSHISPSSQPSSSSTLAQPNLIIPSSTAQVQTGNQMVQLVQSPGGQMVPINGHMVQSTSQPVQPINTQMVQSPVGQMVPMNSQMVHPVNNQMLQPDNNQMLQPDNNQMFQPDNNHMVQQSATQMVNGAQLVVQNNRQTIINNTTTQLNLQEQPNAMNSVRKRTIVHPRSSLSSSTHPYNLPSERDRTLPRRRRTGPIVTSVHSLANVQGPPSRAGHHINRAGQLVRTARTSHGGVL